MLAGAWAAAGIDYGLLFLNKIGVLDRMTEKNVNLWLNTWVRAQKKKCVPNMLPAMFFCACAAGWSFSP